MIFSRAPSFPLVTARGHTRPGSGVACPWGSCSRRRFRGWARPSSSRGLVLRSVATDVAFTMFLCRRGASSPHRPLRGPALGTGPSHRLQEEPGRKYARPCSHAVSGRTASTDRHVYVPVTLCLRHRRPAHRLRPALTPARRGPRAPRAPTATALHKPHAASSSTDPAGPQRWILGVPHANPRGTLPSRPRSARQPRL